MIMLKKNKLVLGPGSSLQEALLLLEENGMGVLAVVDEKDHLIGIITDGDIRKALIRGQVDLEHIINRNPQTLPIGTSRAEVHKVMRSIKRDQVPLVDSDNRLHDIISLRDLEFNIKSNPVVIMAGGLGTRLGSLTKKRPKPMIEVGSKPILAYLVDKFAIHGFQEIYISVNYKSEIIKNYFKDGSEFGVNINYLEEKERLGTGGSLSLLPERPREPFLVINGDIMTTLNFENFLQYHVNSKSEATMCVREHTVEIPFGVIETEANLIQGIYEKPHHKYWVNAGIYLLNPEALDYVPNQKYFDIPTLFQSMIDQNHEVHSYKVEDLWFDVGNIKDLERAQGVFG